MTTGFQFAHLQWSGKKGAKKKESRRTLKGSHGTQRASGWSAKDILAEAARLKGHCQHVASPKPPTLIYGMPLSEVEAVCDAWAASRTVSVKLKNGTVGKRKMRADAPVLASGVISMPKERIDDWPAYRDHAVEELKQKHGNRLLSVVEHLDESHPHLHYYLVPLLGEDFGVVHDGYAASRIARAEPGNKIRSAFQGAMRTWQDWIHEKIAAPFGLARIGPARARLDNDEWKESERLRAIEQAEKRVDGQEKIQQSNQERIDKLLADIERREGLIVKKQQSLDATYIERTAVVAKKLGDLDKTKKELDRLTAENLKSKTELDRLTAENAKSKTELKQVFDTFDLLKQASVEAHQPKILELLQIKKTKSSDLGL